MKTKILATLVALAFAAAAAAQTPPPPPTPPVPPRPTLKAEASYDPYRKIVVEIVGAPANGTVFWSIKPVPNRDPNVKKPTLDIDEIVVNEVAVGQKIWASPADYELTADVMWLVGTPQRIVGTRLSHSFTVKGAPPPNPNPVPPPNPPGPDVDQLLTRLQGAYGGDMGPDKAQIAAKLAALYRQGAEMAKEDPPSTVKQLLTMMAMARGDLAKDKLAAVRGAIEIELNEKLGLPGNFEAPLTPALRTVIQTQFKRIAAILDTLK